jgi:hypothetical protein
MPEVLEVLSIILMVISVVALILTWLLKDSLSYDYISVNEKARSMAEELLWKKADALVIEENIPLEYVDNLGTAAGTYKYTRRWNPFTGSFDIVPLMISVLKKYDNHERLFLVLHELGHHFKIKEENDDSEESADLFIREACNTLPLWAQATLAISVSVYSKTDRIEYKTKDIKKSLKENNITL